MQRNLNILLVEDNAFDVEIFERSVKKFDGSLNMVHAADGVEALSIISCSHEHKKIPRPYLILIDINMPRMNGHEFLERLRKGEHDPTAVTIVFSTSDNPQDIQTAYERGANGYIVKPQNNEEFQNVLKVLRGLWSICEPPPSAS